MTPETSDSSRCRISAKQRRSLYFGLEMWLVLEATAFVALILLECSPMVRGLGTAIALAGLIALVVVFRHLSRRERTHSQGKPHGQK